MKCPNCNYECPENAPDCPSCGIFFSKWNKRKEEASSAAMSPPLKSPGPSMSTPVKPEPEPLLSTSNSKSAWTGWIGVMVMGALLFGLTFVLGRPECLMIALAVTGIEIFFAVAKPILPDHINNGWRIHGRSFIMVATLIAVIQYPYYFSPKSLAPEISIEEYAKNPKKFKNRKIKLSGFASRPTAVGFNIGADEMAVMSLEGPESRISAMVNMRGQAYPDQDDYVEVVGGYRSYGGGKPTFIGESIKIKNEMAPKSDPMKIYALREALQNPNEVTTLDIREPGAFRSLPMELAQFPNLKELYFTESRITELGPVINSLQNLEVLDVSSNRLSELPDDLAQLSMLRRVDISGNEFTAIPPVLARLPRLEDLGLSHNPLKTIGPEIGELKNLKYLSIQYSELEEIHPAIMFLTQLENLNLMNNKLESLPAGLEHLPRKIALRGNPLQQ